MLHIADYRGRVHCFDAKSGEKHWSFDTKTQIWGSTLVVDAKLLVGNDAGEFIILATEKTLKKIGKVDFDSPIYATPVVANGRLYITTQEHLFALEK